MITIKPLTARWATFKLLSSSSRCLSTGKLIQSGKQNEQMNVLDNHESKEVIPSLRSHMSDVIKHLEFFYQGKLKWQFLYFKPSLH